MPKIKINDTIYTCRISYQTRKTVQLEVIDIATINIKAPSHTEWDDIKKFIYKKSNWLLKVSEKLRNRPEPVIIDEGTMVPYLGRLYNITVHKTLSKPEVIISNDKINVYICTNQTMPLIEPFLKQWFVRQAEHELKARTAYWCDIMNVKIVSLSLRDQKTRWGSCSSRGGINYNWRLIMAPPAVIDYLVIHELAHRIEMNHSADFWNIVATYCPDWKQNRAWLRENSQLLSSVFKAG